MENVTLERKTVPVDGARFDVATLGEGAPTVIFVNGLGTPLEEWTLVAPTVARHCRVVCYDRQTAPQNGPVGPHTATQSAADLRRLLGVLQVSGPVILVGHSWGGAIIRRYAFDHPEDIAGMVFVDASHENIKGMIPKRPRATRALYRSTTTVLRIGLLRRRLLRMLGFDRLPAAAHAVVNNLSWLADGRTSRAEFAGIAPSLVELKSIASDLPRVPTRVLLAGGRSNWTGKLGAKQVMAIRAVWERAAHDRQDVVLRTVPDSGHYISLDQPQAVIDAIEEVIRLASPGRVR